MGRWYLRDEKVEQLKWRSWDMSGSAPFQRSKAFGTNDTL
jgi:hypothetical protein